MLELSEYDERKRKEWNSFAMERGNIYHLIEWKEILEECFGYKSSYYMAYEDGTLVGLLPLMTSRGISLKKIGVSLPFVNYLNVCAENSDVRERILFGLEDLRRKHRLEYIELRNVFETGLKVGYSVNTSNYTFLLPLEGGAEGILARSTSNNRNHIRKTLKNDWFSVHIGVERLQSFYEIYSHTMKRLGSPCPSIRFFSSIVQKLPQNVELITIYDRENGKVVGGMFLLKWKDTLYYNWGGSLTGYNKYYANNYMYWQSVMLGINEGFKFLDLGRSLVDSGTYKFKEKWGALPIMLYYYRFYEGASGNWMSEKESMKILIETWKLLPKRLTDIFGNSILKIVMP